MCAVTMQDPISSTFWCHLKVFYFPSWQYRWYIQSPWESLPTAFWCQIHLYILMSALLSSSSSTSTQSLLNNATWRCFISRLDSIADVHSHYASLCRYSSMLATKGSTRSKLITGLAISTLLIIDWDRNSSPPHDTCPFQWGLLFIYYSDCIDLQNRFMSLCWMTQYIALPWRCEKAQVDTHSIQLCKAINYVQIHIL